MAVKLPRRLALLAALLPAAAPAMAQDTSRVRPGDLVVMGYASSRSYEALDEFGMSNMITAELRISKVLRGRAPSNTLTIRYIAHMDLPEDSARRFHLRPLSKGARVWLVCKQGSGLGYICR